MSERRIAAKLTLIAALMLGVGLTGIDLTEWGITAANAADDDEGATFSGPCKAKKFTFAVVEKACKEGGPQGKAKVRDIMKAARSKAGEKGIKINDARVKCTSCHKDTHTYEQHTDNAVEDLRKLLADPTPVVAPKKKP